jgi:tetratricopeptide (TPR) repeat protein
MNWETWGPSIIVLSIGLVLGLVMVIRSRGVVRTDSTVDAWARKDSLVDQLRALRADKNKLDPHLWEAKWIHLLDEAAAALREAEQAEVQPPPETPKHIATDNAMGRRLLWGLAITVFFIGLGATLQMATQDRTQGGTMTGGAIVGGIPLADTIKKLEEEATADPTAIEPRNQLAHIAIQRGEMSDAMKWMDQARALDGEHPEVRTHLAILQISIGMAERAKGELAAALESNPALSEALLWSGLIELRLGNREAAIPPLESALENASNREERMMASSALSEARKPPPTLKLKGQLTLGNDVSPPAGGILFIMVRRTAEGAGPPVAAVRLDPRGIPGGFSITDRDMMMGGAWPEQVWVDARVDTDGNPTTKQSSDLTTARLGPFSAGTEDIVLTLGGGDQTEEPAAPSSPRIQGSIDYKEGVQAGDTGAVFIIVRRSEATSGPPVAALRLKPSDVPGAFAVGDQNIMMGGPWPDQVWVQARADMDGNAMTRDDADISSPLIGPIRAGTMDIVLTLGDETAQ